MEYIGNVKYDNILFQDRRFIIYGYGFYGKELYKTMQAMGVEKKVIAFCDKDAGKYRNEICTILYPEEAIKITDVDFLVIGTYEYEIVWQLIAEGISRIHILTL